MAVYHVENRAPAICIGSLMYYVKVIRGCIFFFILSMNLNSIFPFSKLINVSHYKVM